MKNPLSEYLGGVIAVLAAILLAAHHLPQSASFSQIASYFYWLCRILIEAGCFFAVLIAVEKYLPEFLPNWGTIVVAVLVSLVPFTLAVTALDLVIGLPELGLNEGVQTPTSRAPAFGLEMIYHLDNHIALCLLLSLTRLIPLNTPVEDASSNDLPEQEAQKQVSFFDSLETPLRGDIITIEAQEHYVQIQTSDESRMVLYRFSDAVRQIPPLTGMQVHRSHWVAHAAVKELVMKGQSMQIELHNGSLVPVSRTFRAAVEKRYSKSTI